MSHVHFDLAAIEANYRRALEEALNAARAGGDTNEANMRAQELAADVVIAAAVAAARCANEGIDHSVIAFAMGAAMAQAQASLASAFSRDASDAFVRGFFQASAASNGQETVKVEPMQGGRA